MWPWLIVGYLIGRSDSQQDDADFPFGALLFWVVIIGGVVAAPALTIAPVVILVVALLTFEVIASITRRVVKADLRSIVIGGLLGLALALAAAWTGIDKPRTSTTVVSAPGKPY